MESKIRVVFAVLQLLLWLPAAAAPQKGLLSRSDACGECHRDIYRMWRTSLHARSLEDDVFLDVLRETRAREGEGISRLCLSCHAPAIAVNNDTELKLKVTWEGVSCDICHSMTGAEETPGGMKPVLDVGPVKRGPIRDASSMAHQVAFSEFHTSAMACAPCHEYATPEAVPLLTTWSEWKKSSSAKEGRTCQACHMGRTRANIVDPRVKRVPETEVNLHEVPGGHSLELLNRALQVTSSPVREGDEMVVSVRLRNKGAGHAVPTGMPGRAVVLKVSVSTSEGKTFEADRTYGKTYTDAAGAPIVRDSDYFGKGVRLVSDTRIQADQTREEQFRFPVPRSATGFLAVKLLYVHAPMGGPENRTEITFFSEKRTLIPAPPPAS